jgi:hypothetical protein
VITVLKPVFDRVRIAVDAGFGVLGGASEVAFRFMRGLVGSVYTALDGAEGVVDSLLRTAREVVSHAVNVVEKAAEGAVAILTGSPK